MENEDDLDVESDGVDMESEDNLNVEPDNVDMESEDNQDAELYDVDMESEYDLDSESDDDDVRMQTPVEEFRRRLTRIGIRIDRQEETIIETGEFTMENHEDMQVALLSQQLMTLLDDFSRYAPFFRSLAN